MGSLLCEPLPSDDTWMMRMKCYNCNKNAMYKIDRDGPCLCLDCYIRLRDMEIREQEMLARTINFVMGQLESAAGLPGLLPRFPERPAVIQGGGVTLNNINVSNSEIGVLNTGSIQNVDSTLTVLRQEGNEELVSVLAQLSEAVIKSTQLANDRKNEALELLSSLSEEAVAPKERRKLAVVKAVLAELATLLGGVAAVTGIWTTARTIVERFFGI